MRFDAEDYREAAGERFNEANGAFGRGDYVAAHLAAGLAVESMLRAYRVRVSPDFEERHDLSLLGEAYLRRMPDRRREEVKAAISETAVLWRNNHRYCSSRKLRAFFNRIKRYGTVREMLRANADDMIGHADLILRHGESRWQTPQIPTLSF